VEVSYDPTVICQVTFKGKRPDRPTGKGNMLDELWDLIEQCWVQQPAERLTMKEVLDIMANMNFGRAKPPM